MKTTRAACPPSPAGRISTVFICALLGLICLSPLFGCAPAAEPIQVTVYKTPTCGCCSKWIEHLEQEGFEVESHDLPDLRTVKASNGVPSAMASCHTALIEGYVVEGHVPASDIRRLLAERPAMTGLAVPGMPMGSPGMEHPDPSRHEAYDVMAFGGPEASGRPVRFAHHAP
jgi:hypothetical protein